MIADLLLKASVFFIPFQLGLHLWPAYSRVAGIKIDYLSPTVYLVDLVILSYVLSKSNLLYREVCKNYTATLFVFIALLANISISIIPQISLFVGYKVLLYIFYLLLLKKEKRLWERISSVFLTSLLIVIFLEFLQVIKQASVGGLFYWLGERPFSLSSFGSVKTYFYKSEYIRPQSTFSHPNSLAGYLSVSFLILRIKKSPMFFRLVTFLGLILTLSKGALLAFLLVVVLQINLLTSFCVFIFLSIIQFIPSPLFQNFDFVTSRVKHLKVFTTLLKNHWLFGTGIGNYIPAISENMIGSQLIKENLQPVHNVVLYILSEIGIIGTIVLIKIQKHIVKMTINYELGLFVSLVLISGAFDHYWLTLIQNQLLALLTIAILL